MEIGDPKREFIAVPLHNPYPFEIPGYEPPPEEPSIEPREKPVEDPDLVPA